MVQHSCDFGRQGLFDFVMAFASSDSRNTQNLRWVPVPSGYAPVTPLRASSSKYRRFTERNRAASSADTKRSGVPGGELPESENATLVISVLQPFDGVTREKPYVKNRSATKKYS
jgi:hypothetical protein